MLHHREIRRLIALNIKTDMKNVSYYPSHPIVSIRPFSCLTALTVRAD